MAKKNELLAEAKAWREVARVIALDIERGTFCVSLCWMVREYKEREGMDSRIKYHLDGQLYIESVGGAVCGTTSDYHLPDIEQAKLRVIAALFLALECDDEANALKSSPSKAGGR